MGYRFVSRKFYASYLYQRNTLAIKIEVDPRENGLHPPLVEELVGVKIDSPRQRFQLGTTLLEEQNLALTNTLNEYKELFAWSPSDMP